MDEKQKAYLNYLVSTGMSKEDAYKSYIGQQSNPEESHGLKDMAMWGLDKVARAADYTGGLTRTAVGSAIGQYEEGDLGRALEGNAPGTKEYLQRMGAPDGSLSDVIPGMYSEGGEEWLKFKKGGAMDPTATGAAGLIGDVALDPLTYLTAGLSSATKAGKLGKSSSLLALLKNEHGLTAKQWMGQAGNKVLNPLDNYAQGAAKANYDKAFNWVDKKFRGQKPEAVADILRKDGFVGSAREAEARLAQINSKSGKNLSSIYEEAAGKGAAVDLDTALDAAKERAAELRTLGTAEADTLATQIESRIQKLQDTHAQYSTSTIPEVPAQYETPMYGKEQIVPGTGIPEQTVQTRVKSTLPVDRANEVKTELNSYTNFNPSDTEAIANRGRKAVAGPLSQANKEAVQSVDEELFQRLMKENSTYSSTAPNSVGKRMKQYADQVAQERGRFGGISAVDLMLAGAGVAGAAGDHPEALGVLALKKLGGAAMSTTGRTARASTWKKMAESKVMQPKDAVLRQGVFKKLKDEDDNGKEK